MQAIDSMERETGIEPATSSLGKRSSIENKELTRPLRCILTTENAEKTTSASQTALNGVIGVKNSVRRFGFFFDLKFSPGSLNPAVIHSPKERTKK